MQIFKNPDIIIRDIHSSYFLISIKEKYWKSKSVVAINDTGKLIWELLDKTTCSEEILKQIILICNISQNDVGAVKNDIDCFLENLHNIGYLKYE